MKKYITGLLFGAVLIAPFWAYAQINSGTIAALQAQLKVLMEKVQQLQASQSQAQSGAGGGAGGGGSAGIPISLPVPPPPDFDDDFDDIVQFNNLIVRSVSGPSFPAEIKASYEVGVRCQSFQSESAIGVEYPCPLSPSVLYTIRVDSDTRLLLRNRQRASLADFEVGNRINVYGFTNSGVSSIDALVVRNLTKPVRLSFVQLNNMEALSAPSSGVPPATFTVVNKYFSPCRDFSDGPNSGITLPCPLGLEIMEQPQSSTNVSGGSSGSSLAYYPIPRKYLIEVTRQTTILQRNRAPMPLSDIAVGDILNIYGSYTNSSQNIQAIVIRDLSKPVSDRGSLNVRVVDASSGCIRPLSMSASSPGVQAEIGEDMVERVPCGGTIYNAVVDLYDLRGVPVGTQTTERGAAFFENLRVGEYTIVAGAEGYDKTKTSVSIGAGRVTFATINLSQLQPPPQRGMLYLEPSSLSIEINKTNEIRAMYQPPPRTCPPDGNCTMEIIGPSPVEAKWVIANSGIAGVSYKEPTVALVNGLSVGNTEIKAAYMDSSGNILTAVVPVKVFSFTSSNRPPVISGVKGPTALKVGETGTWSVSAYDPENGQLFYLVMWGDENPESGGGGGIVSSVPLKVELSQTATFTHSYAREGNYTPVFYVTDNQGLSAKTSISVSVSATTPQPAGYLYISPVGFGLGVGQQQKIQAFFQPLVPPCQVNMACAQVMPAPYEVEAQWASSNTSIAVITQQPGSGCNVSSDPSIVSSCGLNITMINGVSAGTAEIKAYYTLYPNSYTAKAIVEVRPVSSQPSITVLSPTSGPVGTNITITGSGFTPSGNMVLFGSGAIPNLLSSDGKTITFALPSNLNPACYYSDPRCLMPTFSVSAGVYQVSVKNANGQSNQMTFTVTQSSILVSTKFNIGDRVKTTDQVNVRRTPSLSNFVSPILGTQVIGALGTISASSLNLATYPVYVNGYWWWYVNFDSGADSWVVESYIEKVLTIALAPTSSQTASLAEALRILMENLNKLVNQLR